MFPLSTWKLSILFLLASGFSLAHGFTCHPSFTMLTSGICVLKATRFNDICSAAAYCVSLSTTLKVPVSLIGSDHEKVYENMKFSGLFWVGIHDLLIPQNNIEIGWQFVDSVKHNRMEPNKPISWNQSQPSDYAIGEQCTLSLRGRLYDYKCTLKRRNEVYTAICQQYAGTETVDKNIYDSADPTTTRFVRNLPEEVVDIFGPFANGCFEEIENSEGSLISCAAR
ncbi:unnamed protein product [Protopolystoma xenopodis]|uniref:C-type lectin domain-containing protein n=1 Tax=Protopolystoma xenopodis TaxID=117903 RepID=A0A3S5AQ52_9PLAT|nr:unnamed protein product [Protopolystoma xenopodis]